MTSIPLTLVLLPGMDGAGRLFRWLVPAIEPAARVQVVSYPPDRILDMGGLADLVIRQLPEGLHLLLQARPSAAGELIRWQLESWFGTRLMVEPVRCGPRSPLI